MMSQNSEPIDDLKPVADLQEQSRPEQDEAEDPEAPVLSVPDPEASEADEADVADQRREVPLDEERSEG